MIRIQKKKTTRKKLTGPQTGKPVAEKAGPRALENKEQGKKRRFPYSKDSRGQKDMRGKRDARPSPRFPEEPKVREEDLEKGAFVLPGELVGTTEEFRAGEGTTVITGDLYSSATGYVYIDRKSRIVTVRPSTNTPNIMKVGDIIFGKITDVRESGAMVEFAGIEGKADRKIVNATRLGDIHVSNVRDSYVKRLANEFRPLDIVRARVVDLDRLRLTTAENSLGVMKAYCSNCKGELVLDQDGNKLKCPVCNRTETRKLAVDYGKGIK